MYGVPSIERLFEAITLVKKACKHVALLICFS